MRDLDRNADGLIQYDEPDLAVKRRLYWQIDRNGDRAIDREEVLSYVYDKLFPPGTMVSSDSDLHAEATGTPQRKYNRRPVALMSLFASEVMLVVTGEDFFEPASAKAIREVVDDLTALPQVANITWLDNAPPLNIFGLPESALPDYRASKERFAQAKSESMLGSPLGLAALVDALPGDGSPVTKASLVGLLPPPLKQAIWSADSHRAIVVFRLQDIGIAKYV